MRVTTMLLFFAVACSFGATARAFHHHNQFQSPADGREETPGSGGLYYSGSQRDLGLRCAHCHVEAEGRIRASVAFSPSVSAGFVRGATYRVTVTMTGETKGLSGCAPMIPNRNGIAATVVGASGLPVGQLSPDGDTRRCGSRYPPVSAGQTTAVFGDCEGVVGVQDGLRSLTSWQFDWRAPSTGTGDVALWLGVVDGNCVFDSYDDDVYETRIDVPESTSAALVPDAPPPAALALAGRDRALPPRRRAV